MFRTLNPFLMLTIERRVDGTDGDSRMITALSFGPTPEESEVIMNIRDGTGFARRPWPAVAPLRLFSQKKTNRSLSEFYLEAALLIQREAANWKDPLPVPLWRPADPVKMFLSPYLRVADLADLRTRLEEDIANLRQFVPVEPDWIKKK